MSHEMTIARNLADGLHEAGIQESYHRNAVGHATCLHMIRRLRAQAAGTLARLTEPTAKAVLADALWRGFLCAGRRTDFL